MERPHVIQGQVPIKTPNHASSRLRDAIYPDIRANEENHTLHCCLIVRNVNFRFYLLIQSVVTDIADDAHNSSPRSWAASQNQAQPFANCSSIREETMHCSAIQDGR